MYTGQQRLAKNTLLNALRKSALSPALALLSTAHCSNTIKNSKKNKNKSYKNSNDDGNKRASTRCLGTIAALIEGAKHAWDIVSELHSTDVDDSLDELADVLNR